MVDDSVYVRTSGFWTGEERPLVAAFEIQTGNEIWRYTSQTSLQHDMAPLLFVEGGSGTCGAWNDLLLVGWTDGKLTALSPTDGSLIWQNQTEVDIIGITGKMAHDGDQVIVPTRTGLSSFCLADGSQLFDIDTGNIGWRNGVAMTEDGYAYGDEHGYLHEVDHMGMLRTHSLAKERYAMHHLKRDMACLSHANSKVNHLSEWDRSSEHGRFTGHASFTQ